jgi:hypothetical protein
MGSSHASAGGRGRKTTPYSHPSWLVAGAGRKVGVLVDGELVLHVERSGKTLLS